MREPVAQQGDGLGEKHLSTVRVSLIASVAALGGFLFGFDTAVINGAIGALERNFTAHAAAVGLSVSSALLGAAAGAVLAGRLADRHGRTRTMLATSLLFVASAAGSG
ncbi:MFS transporter, partial [Corallococcus aberystwythensis]